MCACSINTGWYIPDITKRSRVPNNFLAFVLMGFQIFHIGQILLLMHYKSSKCYFFFFKLSVILCNYLTKDRTSDFSILWGWDEQCGPNWAFWLPWYSFHAHGSARCPHPPWLPPLHHCLSSSCPFLLGLYFPVGPFRFTPTFEVKLLLSLKFLWEMSWSRVPMALQYFPYVWNLTAFQLKD